MPKEESIVSDVKVKFRGVFDLSLIYNKLRSWIIDSGFDDPANSEVKYVEKVKPGGKDIEIVWDTNKKEFDDFFKLTLSVKIYATKINDVEIDQDGRKIKLQKGDIWITFGSKIIINDNKSWDENSLMYKIYSRYMIGDKIEQTKIDLYDTTNNIINEFKNYLSLYGS